MSDLCYSLAGLFTACDAFGIVLEPTADGHLVIEGPRNVLTPQVCNILKAHKHGILLVLLAERELNDRAATAQTRTVQVGLPPNVICRCGSTAWKDVPIHDGQSIRRDCARCRRFVCFPVWYKILDKKTSIP
jgi:hypothetical protein